MEQMPQIALVTTSGYDSLTTDSANSASAYATGHKVSLMRWTSMKRGLTRI